MLPAAKLVPAGESFSSREVPVLQGPSLSLLRIPSTWPSEPSPHARYIEQATRARVLGVKLLPRVPSVLRRFDASQFGLLAAYAYPEATRERLELCNDWHVWLFLFDDEADECADVGQRPAYLQEYMEACLEVLRGGALRTRARPLERFTYDIRRRMERLASESWLSRFADDVESYLFQGTLQASRHWTAGTVPDFDAYLTQRAEDSGMYTCVDLVEFAQEGRELPGHVLATPELRRMRELCTRVVALSNDLFSYEKEVLWSRNPNNLVHVLQVHHALGLEESVAEAIQVVNADVECFQACEERLLQSGLLDDARVAFYVDGMKAWMRGNVCWSLVTGRYCSPTSPFPELRRP